ncbi:hypothetical protein HY090_00045 [Candidatus Kaiserbacteria bacterium]|nr:hypothetical protein [Candidatus Kaiserbacteria bacterium]
MLLLYKGKYYERFTHIAKYLTGKSVVELCFGDTILADYCRENSIRWIGIDVNQTFVKAAIKKGFDAHCADIASAESFPSADTIVMSGSLYHFHDSLHNLFKKMLASAPVVVISEPIVNLSQVQGIIGAAARSLVTVKGKKQPFRFTEPSLKDALKAVCRKLNCTYEIAERFSKDLIVIVRRAEESG